MVLKGQSQTNYTIEDISALFVVTLKIVNMYSAKCINGKQRHLEVTCGSLPKALRQSER